MSIFDLLSQALFPSIYILSNQSASRPGKDTPSEIIHDRKQGDNDGIPPLLHCKILYVLLAEALPLIAPTHLDSLATSTPLLARVLTLGGGSGSSGGAYESPLVRDGLRVLFGLALPPFGCALSSSPLRISNDRVPEVDAKGTPRATYIDGAQIQGLSLSGDCQEKEAEDTKGDGYVGSDDKGDGRRELPGPLRMSIDGQTQLSLMRRSLSRAR